jgi:hypothetical protein
MFLYLRDEGFRPHPLEGVVPFVLRLHLPRHVQFPFVHQFDDSLVLTRVEPIAVLSGTEIEMEVVKAVLEPLQSLPAMRATLISGDLAEDK